MFSRLLMKYKFRIVGSFAKEFKKLAKKNKFISSDFDNFLNTFSHFLGTTISGTGGAQKIRMAAKGTGKRGAFRIIYYIFYENKVYFLKIYSKTKKESITDSEKKQIQRLIQLIKNKEL